MKHSFSCLMYYFSVFGYQMEHSFSCFIYYFSVFGNQMKHLSIQLGTMYSFRLFMQRKQKIQLWITPSHLSKYKDSIPLADRNRNNLVVLARMNNYLYRGWCQIVKFSNCNLFPQRTQEFFWELISTCTYVLRNSFNPARWLKQIKRTVSFDVTARFNPIQQSTAMYNSHIFNGRNTTINDQLKHSKYTVVFLLSLRKAVFLH